MSMLLGEWDGERQKDVLFLLEILTIICFELRTPHFALCPTARPMEGTVAIIPV